MKSGICVAPPPPQRYEPYADFLGELIVAATDDVMLHVRDPSRSMSLLQLFNLIGVENVERLCSPS